MPIQPKHEKYDPPIDTISSQDWKINPLIGIIA